MKSPSLDLFDLIKSLNKGERRYFKIFSSWHIIGNQNNYVTLYDAIQKQDVYDEKALKESLKNSPFINHFPVIKKQLYELILKSLHEYHSSTSPEETIKKSSHQAKILMEKGLYDQAGKLIDKTISKAEENELLEILPEIFEVRKLLLSRQYFKGLSGQELSNIEQEESDNLKKLENLNLIKMLSAKIAQFHYQKISGRTVSDLKEVDKIMQHPILQDQKNVLTFRAQLDFLQVHATSNFIKGETNKAYEYNKQFLDLLNTSGKANIYPQRYVSALNNFLIDSLVLGKYEAVESGIQRLRSLPNEKAFARLENLELNVFRLTYQLELNMFINLKQFKRGTQHKEGILEGLKKFKGKIVKHNVVTLNYLLAYIYFGNREYNEALSFINKILNDREEKAVQEVYSFARLLNLLIHYELGNHQLLESLIKSTYRYQKKREKLFNTEKLILKYLDKLNYMVDPGEKTETFKTFHNELKILQTKPEEKRAFNYFDFAWWTESKIQS